MKSKQIVCFEISSDMQEACLRRAGKEGVGIDDLINRALASYLDWAGQAGSDRRRFQRTPVCIQAVARPLAAKDETFFQGEVGDVSFGGIRLHCSCDQDAIQPLVREGNRVEIVFTIPDTHPVCFICEVRYVYRGEQVGLGCEFLNATGDSFLALKKIISNSTQEIRTA